LRSPDSAICSNEHGIYEDPYQDLGTESLKSRFATEIERRKLKCKAIDAKLELKVRLRREYQKKATADSSSLTNTNITRV